MFCKPWKEYKLTVADVPMAGGCRGIVFGYLEGHVGDVDELVVRDGEQVEEAQLRESPRLDLFHTVPVNHELLQRGQTIE